MRPSPFQPESYNGDNRFVRDQTTGLVWHKVSYRTLYADTDRSKLVYHSNYFRFFELGRATLMRDIAYSYQEVEESGYLYPIVDLGISFFYPLYYDDPIWVYTRPFNLERVRVTFDYLITHAESETLICKGFTKHCATRRAGKVTAVDPMTVKMWESFPK